MNNSLNTLYNQLASIDFMNVSEVNHTKMDYYCYSSSTVFTSVSDNCIIMRERNGCAINLRNLDQYAELYSSTFIWFFLGDIIQLERYTEDGLEHLCTLHEENGQLSQKESRESDYIADISIIGNQVEIMMMRKNENEGAPNESMCLNFMRSPAEQTRRSA